MPTIGDIGSNFLFKVVNTDLIHAGIAGFRPRDPFAIGGPHRIVDFPMLGLSHFDNLLGCNINIANSELAIGPKNFFRIGGPEKGILVDISLGGKGGRSGFGIGGNEHDFILARDIRNECDIFPIG